MDPCVLPWYEPLNETNSVRPVTRLTSFNEASIASVPEFTAYTQLSCSGNNDVSFRAKAKGAS